MNNLIISLIVLISYLSPLARDVHQLNIESTSDLGLPADIERVVQEAENTRLKLLL